KEKRKKKEEYSQNIRERSGAGTRPDQKQNGQNQQKHVESFFSGLSDESRRDSFEARAILKFLSLSLARV
ncbi:unnamed protein product, partial [Brassica oleracea]